MCAVFLPLNSWALIFVKLHATDTISMQKHVICALSWLYRIVSFLKKKEKKKQLKKHSTAVGSSIYCIFFPASSEQFAVDNTCYLLAW